MEEYITTNKFVEMEKEVTKLSEQMKEHCRSNDENFAEVKADIKDVKNDIKDVKEAVDSWFNKADKRYASKVIEQLFYSSLGAVTVYIIYKLIDLI